MKIIFERLELLNIINTIQKAVTAKTTMPILECIKIDSYIDGKVVFLANNLDLSIEYTTNAKVDIPGSIAISSKMFGEIIRRFSDNDVLIDVNETNNVMYLKCGNSEFNIQGLNGNEYPQIPEVQDEYSFSVKQSQLKRMIRKTSYAISNNESRKPILTGSLFDIDTGVLTVVATDGYRISKVENTVDAPLENMKFVIPGIALREIIKVLEDTDDAVRISVSKRHVKFYFDNFVIVSRLLEGEYIKYRPIFNTPNTIVVTVNTKDFLEILERAALIINDDATARIEKVPVRLKIEDGNIDLTCTTGKGNINDSVEISKIGPDIEIGFNHRYLQDALKSCEDDEIKLSMSNPKGACFIEPVEASDYINMILPVRLFED